MLSVEALLALDIPHDLTFLQMACIQDSISHRADSHSSRHHWQWSTSCSEWLLELSTLQVSSHLGTHSKSHLPNLLTSQNQKPMHNLEIIETLFIQFMKQLYTLQILSFETRMFLAARSLCTNPLAER